MDNSKVPYSERSISESMKAEDLLNSLVEQAQSYGFTSILQAITTAGQYINGTKPDVAPSTPPFTPSELKMMALSLACMAQVSKGRKPLPIAMEVFATGQQQFRALTRKVVHMCGVTVPAATLAALNDTSAEAK